MTVVRRLGHLAWGILSGQCPGIASDGVKDLLVSEQLDDGRNIIPCIHRVPYIYDIRRPTLVVWI